MLDDLTYTPTFKKSSVIKDNVSEEIFSILLDENYNNFLEYITEYILKNKDLKSFDFFNGSYKNIKYKYKNIKYKLEGNKIEQVKYDLKNIFEYKIKKSEISYDLYKNNIFINQILSFQNIEKNKNGKIDFNLEKRILQLINNIINYKYSNLIHYINEFFYIKIVKKECEKNISILKTFEMLKDKILELVKEGKITEELLEIHPDFIKILNSEIIIKNSGRASKNASPRDRIELVLENTICETDGYFSMLDKTILNIKNNKILGLELPIINLILEKEGNNRVVFYEDILYEIENIKDKKDIKNIKEIVSKLERYIEKNCDL